MPEAYVCMHPDHGAFQTDDMSVVHAHLEPGCRVVKAWIQEAT